jgi:hypothetical protein
VAENFRAYSLAVDSRDGRLYVGSFSGSPAGGATVNRVVTIYGQGLQQISRIELPVVQQNYHPLAFLLDPQQPGLYLASLNEPAVRRIDPNGANLQSWQLPLESGISQFKSDPATGRIFLLAPQDHVIAEFKASTGTIEEVEASGSDQFALVHFMSAERMLVLDGRDGKFYLLTNTPALQQNPLTRDNKARRDAERGLRR